MVDHVAIRRVLAGVLNGIPDMPAIAWENTAFTPVVGDTYLSEAILFGESVPLAIDFGGTEETVGVYQVSVNAPTDTTTFPALELARTIKSAFARGIYTDTTTGQKLEITRVSLNPALIEAPWLTLPVSINFKVIE